MNKVVTQVHNQRKWSMVEKDPKIIPIEEIDLSHPGIWRGSYFFNA